MSSDNELLDADVRQEEGNAINEYRSTDEKEREETIAEEILKKEEVEKASEDYPKWQVFVSEFLEEEGSSKEKKFPLNGGPYENSHHLEKLMRLLASGGSDDTEDSIQAPKTSQDELSQIEEKANLRKKYSRLMEFVRDYRSGNESRSEKFRDSRDQDHRPLRLRRLSLDIILKSKQEIIQNALKIVCEQMNAQSAAIFLFSKDGVLERAGIHGIDKDLNPLTDDWFPDEKYEIGESFTGKAAQPKSGSKYGKIQYTSALGNEALKGENNQTYSQKLGSLKCSIAIPLNGRNKTYGVLRVVNKIARDSATDSLSLIDSKFSEKDVDLLLLLAVYVGNVLSNFRRDIQTEIFKYLSHLLIQPYPSQPSILKGVYQEIVDLLVKNPETAFKACILRSKNDTSKLLDVEVTSLAEGVSDSRDDESRSIVDDEILWLVVFEHKPLVLQGSQVESEIRKFKNRKWIEENNLQSFGCFPLIVKEDDLCGTLSFYAGYNYEFHPDSIDFLQSIADLLASFMMRGKNQRDMYSLGNTLMAPHSQSFELSTTVSIETEFRKLAEQWYQETAANPSITAKLMHPAYLQIIGLGPKVVPYILRELQQRNDHWFLALKSLTRENPVELEQRGRMSKMAEAWIRWGRSKGYVLD